MDFYIEVIANLICGKVIKKTFEGPKAPEKADAYFNKMSNRFDVVKVEQN